MRLGFTTSKYVLYDGHNKQKGKISDGHSDFLKEIC